MTFGSLRDSVKIDLNVNTKIWITVLLVVFGIVTLGLILYLDSISAKSSWALFLTLFSMFSAFVSGQKGIEKTHFRRWVERFCITLVVIGMVFVILSFFHETPLTLLVITPVSLFSSGIYLATRWGFWENLPHLLNQLRKPVLGAYGVGTGLSFMQAIASSMPTPSNVIDQFLALGTVIGLTSFVVGTIVGYEYRGAESESEEEEETDNETENPILIPEELFVKTRSIVEGLELGYTLRDAACEALRDWITEKEEYLKRQRETDFSPH